MPAAEPHLMRDQVTSSRSDTNTALEASLYPPVKRFLESLGYVVKGEIGGCDLVGIHKEGAVVIIGELKLRFNLELLLQAVDRMPACDEVWLAVRASGRAVRRPRARRGRHVHRRPDHSRRATTRRRRGRRPARSRRRPSPSSGVTGTAMSHHNDADRCTRIRGPPLPAGQGGW